jgi:hypothetical protein
VQAVHGERIARQKLSETQILHQSQLSEDDEPCGETCFILPITSSYAEDESNDWTEDESAIIHESLLAIQTHPRAACIISQGFSKIRSCREVHRFITKIVATPKVHKQKLSDDDHRTLKWWDKERRRLVGDEWKRNTKLVSRSHGISVTYSDCLTVHICMRSENGQVPAITRVSHVMMLVVLAFKKMCFASNGVPVQTAVSLIAVAHSIQF